MKLLEILIGEVSEALGDNMLTWKEKRQLRNDLKQQQMKAIFEREKEKPPKSAVEHMKHRPYENDIERR